jgi:hypothetical protein
LRDRIQASIPSIAKIITRRTRREVERKRGGMCRTSDTVSMTSPEAPQQQPCLGPLGYSRFPFSDAFLSPFLSRPLADRDNFLFSGTCALLSLALSSSPSTDCLTYVAPRSFIPATSFRHSVTFMYGVLANFTLSILSVHHISTPTRTPLTFCFRTMPL